MVQVLDWSFVTQSNVSQIKVGIVNNFKKKYWNMHKMHILLHIVQHAYRHHENK